MNYIHTATQQVESISAIRAANPNMSIPDGADLASLGYAQILPASPVQAPGPNQQVVQRSPQFLDGQWREVYELVDVPPQVPQQITRAQGKAALITVGLWGAVTAHVAAIPDAKERALAEVALHDTLNWQRSSPFLNEAAAGLGMTSSQLDDLFILASGIEL